MIAAISLHGAAAATLRGDQKRSLQTLYYPRYTGDYDTGWCSTTNAYAGGSQGYSTELACCNAVFPGQTSGKCYSMLPAPPTTAPTPTDGVDIWYADLSLDWAAGVCINTLPTPNGRTTYDSQLECCKGSYTGQTSGACIQDLPDPPTAAPIGSDAPFFPIWSGWDSSYCDNDPTLNTSGAQYFYATQAECCDAWFSQQSSGACMQHDPVYGSRAPTGAPVQ